MKKKYTYLVVIFLIIASCAAFGRIAGNEFINCDDNEYIVENSHIQSGFNSQTIKWATTAVVQGCWHPLTMLSHMLDWSLFGANASGHHLVSLLLHIGAVIFLFLFLNKTTNNIWPSAFAAALFALHPLRVESVAWASERKDVLSMFFAMACLYAYAFYAEKTKLSKYLLCMILFALALMSKPMMVTLPFVLMLLDYWPLGRWQKALTPVKVPIAPSERAKEKKTKKHEADIIKEKKISMPLMSRFQIIRSLLWEKAPFIFLAFIFSIVTLWSQNKDKMIISTDKLPFLECFRNAIVSYVAYLGKIFWPVNLAVFYPFELHLPIWKILISGIIIIIITIAVIYYIKKLPFLFVGWFWYLGTLFPVIGLVKFGIHAIADRYTYMPSIGIAMMLAWGIPSLIKSENLRKKILFPAGIAYLAILAVLTWQQSGYWKNSLTLFSHALQITKNNYLADSHVAEALLAEGKNEEAIDYHNKAISITPDNFMPYFHRGVVYSKLGQYQRAIEDFNKAINLKPDYAKPYNNRAFVYTKLSQYQRAIEDLNKAINLEPNYANAYFNRGIAYYKLGQYKLAIEDFSKAIHLKEDYAIAYNNRAAIYLEQGNKELGCRDAQKACALGQCNKIEAARVKEYCR
jgi:tetratricopeptide (TPR) repeat protein